MTSDPTHLIFIKIITTAGCVRKLSQLEILQLERKQPALRSAKFYTHCKITQLCREFTHF